MRVRVICFLPGKDDPSDPSQLVGECNGDEPERFLLRQLPDPFGHRRWLILDVALHSGRSDEKQSA